MLYYSIVFLVIAMIAAMFGLVAISSAAMTIAKILFFGFLLVLLVTIVMAPFRRHY